MLSGDEQPDATGAGAQFLSNDEILVPETSFSDEIFYEVLRLLEEHD